MTRVGRRRLAEIPLLIDEGDSSLPTLDSTSILARDALRAAAQESPPRGA